MISKSQATLIRQLESKKYRTRYALFVAEGPKVVGDLLAEGWAPHSIFMTEDCTLQVSESIAITADELKRISFLQHPQQVVALFRLPVTEECPRVEGLSLVLDGVQDPGNLGTIIRIADWFDIRTIYCSADTADCWNPKVVQATMGSIARVNVVYTDIVKLLTETQLPVYGTMLDGKDIYTEELTSNGLIVMGNEGNGISLPVRSLIERRLLIPCYASEARSHHAESLNVSIATAIVCSEFRRRMQTPCK